MRIERNLFIRNTAHGLGLGNTGSGGGLWTHFTEGSVIHNTFVQNGGLGESQSNGGGILIVRSAARLTVGGNILALNIGGGARGEWGQGADFGTNLFWEDEGGHFPQIRYESPSAGADSAAMAAPRGSGEHPGTPFSYTNSIY